MVAYFNDSKLDRLNIIQRAQVIHYLLDERDRYAGVEQVKTESMYIYFIDKSIDIIKCMGESDTKASPMHAVNHKNIQLEDFNWLI